MKNILRVLLLSVLLSGCYEDKGNYDYTLDSMNEITAVSFSPSIYANKIEVLQAMSEDDVLRRVDVILEQTLSDNIENLDFNWILTYNNKKGESVTDTVHSKGFLEVELPVGEKMSYDVFLQIYDKSTTLSHYSSFELKTRPIFQNSLFVLHGEEGDRKLGNIEVIGDNTNIRTDIQSVNLYNDYKNAIGLSYTLFYNFGYNYLTGRGDSKFVFSLSVYDDNAGATVYDPFGMDTKFVSRDIFKPKNSNFVFKKMIQTGNAPDDNQYRIALSENGDVYIGNYTHVLYKPGYQNELDNDELHQTNYKITAATITHNRFLFWDEANGRFLYSAKNSDGMAYNEEGSTDSLKTTNAMLDAHVDFSTLDKSPADMSAVLGYTNYRDNYTLQNSYFIFKDNEGNFYRYELAATNTDKDGKDGGGEDKAAYTIKGELMKNFNPGENLSTVTYNSWFTTNYLFYVNGSNVYRYNVSNGDNSIVYEAPAGYEITMIKFRTEDNAVFDGDLGRYLSIGLYNGINGAVAEIKFNTAADVDESFSPLFYEQDNNGNKWGRIKDMQFVREYQYYLPDYYITEL